MSYLFHCQSEIRSIETASVVVTISSDGDDKFVMTKFVRLCKWCRNWCACYDL